MRKAGAEKDFPKILHFMWWQGQFEIPEEFALNLERWRMLNSDHEIVLWDEHRFLAWMEREFPEDVAGFMRIPSSPAKSGKFFRDIRKTDAARFFILARLGGAYFDLDLVPQKPVASFLDDRGIVLRDRGEEHFCQITGEDLSKRSFVSLRSFEHLLFCDTRMLDAAGYAVLNGAMFSRPAPKDGRHWMLDFVRERIKEMPAPAGWFRRRRDIPSPLKCFGSHAIAYYMREHKEELKQRVFTLPGHYVAWDPKVFGERIWWFVLATHDGAKGGESWGMQKKGA